MNLCWNLFRRKTFKPQPKQLRIDGVKTVLTAADDDAELAAHALLETLSIDQSPLTIEHSATAKKGKRSKNNGQSSMTNSQSDVHNAAYYQQMSDRVKEGREAEARSAMRFIAYCEQELKNKSADTRELELGLYKFQNAVEREGGKLLKRWQHCLAECIVRQMVSDEKENEKQRYDEAENY